MNKVGLLPLYLKLYDDTSPDAGLACAEFLEIIAKKLLEKGLEIVRCPICRISKEFEGAVELFKKEDVDAVITLHLAYSPSLESSESLKSLGVPVIVLDTTVDYDFSFNQSPDRIMYNHGIHGVQDMCNLLLRNNVDYYVCAGHYMYSNVLDRVYRLAKAAAMSKKLKTCNIGIIGKPFPSMGDFGIGFDVIKDTVGPDVTEFDFNDYSRYEKMITKEEIDEEFEINMSMFKIENIDETFHKKSLIPNLVVRKWVQEKNLDGFTVNFLDIKKGNGFVSMPFLEAGKQMAIGKGYAGEGDVLTAGLVASLMAGYKDVSFVEMFCPDWKNNAMFISHMGEMNVNLTTQKPLLIEKPFPYTDAENPVCACGRFKAGKAVTVDLAPIAQGKYNLILSKVNMIEPIDEDNFKNAVRGWFIPEKPLSRFMEDYSASGGTHHLALVYTDSYDIIEIFGKMAGFNVVCV